jgi:hypothetical protein
MAYLPTDSVRVLIGALFDDIRYLRIDEVTDKNGVPVTRGFVFYGPPIVKSKLVRGVPKIRHTRAWSVFEIRLNPDDQSRGQIKLLRRGTRAFDLSGQTPSLTPC